MHCIMDELLELLIVRCTKNHLERKVQEKVKVLKYILTVIFISKDTLGREN